jgi:hypothetical protein
LANTSIPNGHYNTEADNAESGKAVIFTTVETIEANEQILWEYHSIFDDTNALADFSNPTSCDLRAENLAPIRMVNDLADFSNLASGDLRAESRVADSAITASDPYHQLCPAQHPLRPLRTEVTGHQCNSCLGPAIPANATVWSCGVYDCDFDICCVCCEYNQVKAGFKADDGDHESACFDNEEDCQNRKRKIEIPQPEPPEAKSPTEAENRIARTANKWLITMTKLEEDQLANRADDNSPTSPSPELSDDEQSDQDGAQQHQRARAPGSIEWKNDPSNRGHTSMQDWPRPNAEVFQNTELEEMDMREPQEAKDAINPCECECHLPGPRTRCTCRRCQRHPRKRPHRLHEDVETRIRKDNLVRKHMACADCCKASAKDKSFFTADPNERIEVALGPY